jgi:hypothetical protein
MNYKGLISINVVSGENSIIVQRVSYGKDDVAEGVREYKSIYGVGGVGNKADWLAIGADAKVQFVTFIEKDGKEQRFVIDSDGDVKEGKAEPVVKKSKKKKDRDFAQLYAKADAAGVAAGEAALPSPMALSGGGGGEEKKHYYISEGACGFAWVKVRPANSAFGRWLKKYKGERKAYNGGIDIWCGHFGQSIDRKSAWADAFAGVLQEAGIKAYGDSRLD